MKLIAGRPHFKLWKATARLRTIQIFEFNCCRLLTGQLHHKPAHVPGVPPFNDLSVSNMQPGYPPGANRFPGWLKAECRSGVGAFDRPANGGRWFLRNDFLDSKLQIRESG